MRLQHDRFQFEQGGRHLRFGGEDIQARAAKGAVLERRNQSRLIARC